MMPTSHIPTPMRAMISLRSKGCLRRLRCFLTLKTRGGGVESSQQLIEVNDLGNTALKSLRGAFAGAYNLEKVSGGVTDQVTDMSMMFSGYPTPSPSATPAPSLESLDLSHFNTSNVTHMYGMFLNASVLTSLNLSGWNTSSVTNMYGMFLNASGLTSLNAHGWNVDAVTNSPSIFDGTPGGPVVYCDQDPGPGTGTLFGKACDAGP
jgi:surface protein